MNICCASGSVPVLTRLDDTPVTFIQPLNQELAQSFGAGRRWFAVSPSDICFPDVAASTDRLPFSGRTGRRHPTPHLATLSGKRLALPSQLRSVPRRFPVIRGVVRPAWMRARSVRKTVLSTPPAASRTQAFSGHVCFFFFLGG